MRGVFGEYLIAFARITQCVLCCRCGKGCSIRADVDHKRFLINTAKLIVVLLLAIDCSLMVVTFNEQLANGANSGQLLFKTVRYPAIP